MSARESKVGEYVPDLIVSDQLVVDTKVIDRITNVERGQSLDYLKITGLRVGLSSESNHG